MLAETLLRQSKRGDEGVKQEHGASDLALQVCPSYLQSKHGALRGKFLSYLRPVFRCSGDKSTCLFT